MCDSYRPDGIRHSKTSKANTVTHYWDGQNIIAEANAIGNIRGKYLRGVNLIVQEIDNQSWYHTHNAHGDVVQRIRDNGEAAPVYHYDAFGNEREPNPNDPNPFRYCGEYWDRETESYYLRARCYVPRVGRFSSEDNVRSFANPYANGQEIIDPLSLNLYVYCYNNPINYIDPSGHFSIGKGIMGAFAILAGAAAIAAAIAAAPVVAGISLVVATATFAAGAMALMFGANEVAESVTGVNNMRDVVTGGNADLNQAYYEAMTVTTVGASAGVMYLAPYAQNTSPTNQAKPQNSSSKGLIGKDYEDWLVKQNNGQGSFKVGGREFDGRSISGNMWWEAKSGGFWDMLMNNPAQLAKFKSSMGDYLNIARNNGATYQLYSNTAIPQEIQDWLIKKGINFTITG